MDTVCLRTVSMEWNAPEKYGPHGGLLLFLIQKKLAIVPNSEAGESESCDSHQAGKVNTEALHVIGVHGSGDNITLFLQDWELAKVALSCHMALDILCQEMYEVERRRGWYGF